MDSLLANYASSDEEEREEQPQRQQLKPTSEPVELKSETGAGEGLLSNSPSKPGGIFNSLPSPKSSLFSSLPRHKSESFPNRKAQSYFEQREEHIGDQILDNSKPKSSPSSLFSSLPLPKSSSSSSSSLKRVVQFRPPTMPNPYSISGNDEDEDEDEDEKERQRKKSKESVSTSSVMSFLSSIPAPRHTATLGSLPSASGTSRRSMLETDAPASTDSVTGNDAVVSSNVGYSKDQSNEMNFSGWSLGSESYPNDSGYGAGHGENVASAAVTSVMDSDAGTNTNMGSSEVKFDELNYDYSSRSSGSENYFNDYSAGHCVNVGPGAVDYSYGDGAYVEYTNSGSSYGDQSNTAQYGNNWADVSIESSFPEVLGVVENALQVPGKRGRKDAPQQIVEVKQDELIKNRPREDQVKMTGIAFGPAYQPTSTKGKPSKLHKRKHQIGSLFFDMKQKETELAERRSKGYATKAQTQAKYGW